MYVVKKNKGKKNKQTKRKQTKKNQNFFFFLYDSLVLYLTKQWLNP